MIKRKRQQNKKFRCTLLKEREKFCSFSVVVVGGKSSTINKSSYD
jgi:hypothetical protein